MEQLTKQNAIKFVEGYNLYITAPNSRIRAVGFKYEGFETARRHCLASQLGSEFQRPVKEITVAEVDEVLKTKAEVNHFFDVKSGI